MPKTSYASIAYSEKLKNPLWQRKRLEIMQRDEFSCRDCSSSDLPLSVHHTIYVKGKEPWEYPDTLLITVCDECHVARQALEERARLALAKILIHASGPESSPGHVEISKGATGWLTRLVKTLEREADLLNDPEGDECLDDIVFCFRPDYLTGIQAIKVCKERGISWDELFAMHSATA